MKVSLTAVVPVYNEEKFVRGSVEKLLKVQEIDEIFIVDDCSTDNSPSILKNLEEDNKKISLFKTSINGGKGKAITKVQENLNTDYIIIHDADLEYNPEDIKLMIKSINNEKSNLVLGSRFKKDKKKQIYLRTYLANMFLSFLFSVIYFSRITDIASCYKLMPVNYFSNTTFKESSFSIEVELIAKFLRREKSVVEVPISYKARSYEEGKKIKLKDGFLYIWAMLIYRFS